MDAVFGYDQYDSAINEKGSREMIEDTRNPTDVREAASKAV